MGFTEAVKSVFSNYANFSGRARRSEYWYFILSAMLVQLMLYMLMAIGGGFNRDAISLFAIIIALFTFIYDLVLIIPRISVSIRRLHDTGRSGWNLLWGFVPLIGSIIVLIFMATDSVQGENQYGPNPKGY